MLKTIICCCLLVLFNLNNTLLICLKLLIAAAYHCRVTFTAAVKVSLLLRRILLCSYMAVLLLGLY